MPCRDGTGPLWREKVVKDKQEDWGKYCGCWGARGHHGRRFLENFDCCYEFRKNITQKMRELKSAANQLEEDLKSVREKL
jgi:hypothetical protein